MKYLMLMSTVCTLMLGFSHGSFAGSEVMINGDTGVDVQAIKNDVDASGALEITPETPEVVVEEAVIVPVVQPVVPSKTVQAPDRKGLVPPDGGELADFPLTSSEEFARDPVDQSQVPVTE